MIRNRSDCSWLVVSQSDSILESPHGRVGRPIRAEVAQEPPSARPSPENVAIVKLRALREAKGIALAALAARTGITRGNLARLESRKNATLRTPQRYADGLDCELEINVVSVDVRKKTRRGAEG
ncbi:MAG: helix-turn-helix transcriptional regulator [Planctomycetes bacterium]|nr:helix-turn-helix transcriptional regulator [Planctomycetota bacterium]